MIFTRDALFLVCTQEENDVRHVINNKPEKEKLVE